MSINNKFLKLCSANSSDVIIKPEIDISFSDDEVWYDNNNICWQVLSGTSYTVTTSYNDWVTFTKYVNNDCDDCVQNNSNLIPKFPFTYEMTVSENGENCLQNCDEKPVQPTIPNSCYDEIVTIFPMTVECQTIDPTSNRINDGQVCLKIKGGSKPYTIAWNGDVTKNTQCLKNLGGGTNTAVVTDFYGDYTVIQTCELIAPIDYSVCFAFQCLECFYLNSQVINQTITNSGFYKNKPYYELCGYFVFWTGTRWEFRTELNENQGVLISYLDQNSDLPISFTGWVNIIGYPSIAHSSENCIDNEICIYVDDQTNINTTILKYKPICIFNGKYIYNEIDGEYNLFYNFVTNRWELQNKNDNNVYGFMNNNFYLPITNISNNPVWTITNSNVKQIITLSGECPTNLVIEDLCMTIGCDSYSFIYKYQKLNDKPTWETANSQYKIFYQTSQNRWVVSGNPSLSTGSIFSTTSSDVPTNSWVELGGLSRTVIVNQGNCPNNINFTINRSNESCAGKKDGSITVIPSCPLTNAIYNLNGGNYVTTPTFTNLASGTYNVCVSAQSKSESCSTVVIDSGPIQQNYSIQLTYFKLSLIDNNTTYRVEYTIIMKDENQNIINTLPPNLIINLLFTVGIQYRLTSPDGHTVTITEEVKNNGNVISPSVQTNTTQTTVDGCPGFSKDVTISSYNYNIELKNQISFSSLIDIKVLPPPIQNNCTTNDFKLLISSSITNISSNCSCCDINKLEDPFTLDLSSVETYLKYAEAVGLTQSAAVP
jgi:hypothetical protein